ncbi:hypothetical protein JCM8547_002727 [Rhodosporidiobolus lusitaniae]
MSSFRRRTALAPLPGTRPSPSSGSSPLLSTGLPSIDDLLGGGLPLSTSLLILSDSPSSYSDLLFKYWVAQGLECGQEVCVVASGVEGGPEGVAGALMGTEGGGGEKKEETKDREDRELEEDLKEKMKIAFRYEGMKQHKTTLDEARASRAGETDTYSSVFDLTTTRTLSAADRKLLHLVDVDNLPLAASSSSSSSPADELYDALYARLEKLVNEGGFRHSSDPAAPRKALRIAISNFGSPLWGAVSPTALYRFLTRLRHFLSTSHSSCLLTFPSHLYTSPPSSSSSSVSSSLSAPLTSPLETRLSHASSAVLRLTSLSSSPQLAQLFPRHAGLLTFPKLPLLPPSPSLSTSSSSASATSLVPPGSKLSLLRGLGGGGQGRDNLIGFRVKRRRFVVEVVSDDPGGEDEGEKRKKERRKRVEEANRKEREMAGGLGGSDVLLQRREGREGGVRIGGEEFQQEHVHGLGCDHSHHPAPASNSTSFDLPPAVPTVSLSFPSSTSSSPSFTEPAAPLPAAQPKKSAFKKRVGVSFGGFDGDEGHGKQEKEKKPSVSSMIHSRPDLLDF